MREVLGYENCLISMMIEEQHFGDLLDRVVDFNIELARIARQRYGMEIVAMTDDVANDIGLLMSPELYFRLIAPRFRRVVQGYKSLGYLTIKHSDGDIRPLIDRWLDSGIDCLDPVDPAAGLDLGDFKRRYGGRNIIHSGVPAANYAVMLKALRQHGCYA
ncbi:MAG: uroporphyrinogen decarboxylase family protein [Spirochaetia bacterium]|jgi:uroporphyrinogen decarboxylase